MTRGWLTFAWVSLFVLVVVGGTVVLCWRYWEALQGDSGDTIRNVALVAGAIIAIGLALWRSRIAERQVQAAERSSLDDQFQRAAEMLGHDVLSVRIGGVASLHHLAIHHFDRYGWRVCKILECFMDLRMKGVGMDEAESLMTVERTVGGKYEGGVDGAQAFEAFWDIQEKLTMLRPPRRRKRWWHRLGGWNRREQ